MLAPRKVKFEAQKRENLEFRTFLKCNADEKELDEQFFNVNHLDLFQAVMMLDKKYRVPILLFYYEGYSAVEIAAILGIPEKTVTTRLFRARTRLKDYLKEE